MNSLRSMVPPEVAVKAATAQPAALDRLPVWWSRSSNNGAMHALVFAAIAVESIDGDSVTTCAPHRLRTGDGPVLLSGSPIYFWWITTGDRTGHLADSFEDAMNGVSVALEGTAKSVQCTDTSERVYWTPSANVPARRRVATEEPDPIAVPQAAAGL